MGPVLAADSTTVQKLQIRLIRQSRGFEALARLPPCEMFSRDPPEFRINNGNQSVQRFCAAVVPRRQHSGDVVVVLCSHADRNPNTASAKTSVNSQLNGKIGGNLLQKVRE